MKARLMKRALIFILTLLLISTSLIPVTAFAADTSFRVAKIHSLKGTVTVLKAGGEKSFNAFKDMSLAQGDTLTTGSDSSATLYIDDDKEVKVDENTKINMSDLGGSLVKKKESTGIKLWFGKVFASIKKKLNIRSKFEIKTPTTVAGARGTGYFVSQRGMQTDIVVLDGTVAASTNGTGPVSASGGSASQALPPQQMNFIITANQQVAIDPAAGIGVPPPVRRVTQGSLGLFELQTLQELVQQAPSRVPPGIDPTLLKGLDQAVRQRQEEKKQEDQKKADEAQRIQETQGVIHDPEVAPSVPAATNTTTSQTSNTPPSTTVSFADPYLQEAVNHTLGRSAGMAVSFTDAATVTSLIWDNSSHKITNLQGIQYLSNLGSLDLSNNAISDVSPLQGLGNLHELVLNTQRDGNGNPILSNISSLSHLTDLQYLYLRNNDIDDISSLAALSKLEVLDLSQNRIGNNLQKGIRKISHLPRLEELYLGWNEISDVTDLVSLDSSLKTLDASYQNGSQTMLDISPIVNGMENLETLKARGDMITGIGGIQNMTSLVSLDLSDNQILSIQSSAFSGMSNLKNLILCGNQLTNLDFVPNISNLEDLDISYNEVASLYTSDTTPTYALRPGLKTLIAGHNPLQGSDASNADIIKAANLAVIDSLTGLESLHLECFDNGLFPSGHWSGLKSSDISGLSDLCQLEELGLAENQIDDLATFNAFPNLKKLNLSGNNITCIDDLAAYYTIPGNPSTMQLDMLCLDNTNSTVSSLSDRILSTVENSDFLLPDGVFCSGNQVILHYKFAPNESFDMSCLPDPAQFDVRLQNHTAIQVDSVSTGSDAVILTLHRSIPQGTTATLKYTYDSSRQTQSIRSLKDGWSKNELNLGLWPVMPMPSAADVTVVNNGGANDYVYVKNTDSVNNVNIYSQDKVLIAQCPVCGSDVYTPLLDLSASDSMVYVSYEYAGIESPLVPKTYSPESGQISNPMTEAVYIQNNLNPDPDYVSVYNIHAGDIIKVYDANGTLINSGILPLNSSIGYETVAINDLGSSEGNIQISIVRIGKSESAKVVKHFVAEDASENPITRLTLTNNFVGDDAINMCPMHQNDILKIYAPDGQFMGQDTCQMSSAGATVIISGGFPPDLSYVYATCTEYNNNHPKFESCMVPLLISAPSLQVSGPVPGSAPGKTSVVVSPAPGNAIWVDVASTYAPGPMAGDPVPGTAVPYVSGADIPGDSTYVDDTINKYLNVYEVNSAGKIVAYNGIVLTNTDVAGLANQIGGWSCSVGSDIGATEIIYTPSLSNGEKIYFVHSANGAATPFENQDITGLPGLQNFVSYQDIYVDILDHIRLYKVIETNNRLLVEEYVDITIDSSKIQTHIPAP